MSKARFERDGDVAIVTLADPPFNFIGPEIVDDLEAAIDQVRNDQPRAMLIRAEGDNFSAGANVLEMFRGRSQKEAFELLNRVTRMLEITENFPFPTVAAVQGMCLTGGLEVALTCDMIWAAEGTNFGQMEAVIGAVPFGGGAQRLAERCGPARAREIVFGMGTYDAETFERWNIINRIVPAADLAEKSLKFAKRLAAGPTLAFAATKKVLRAYLDDGVREADRVLTEFAPPLFESEDMREGIESMLNNGPGKAKFRGK